MAEVFRAAAEGPHGFARTVVVKRILPRLAATPEFVQMFIDEAKISARLSHPNIVQTFAFAETAGSPVLVMEHVAGRDLGSILLKLAESKRSVPPAAVAEIARQCCAALDYAHRLTDADGKPLGIVHRDVTPSNIMISRDGTVKLLDFGIARAAREVREGDTAVGTMKGKMGYVAPEQIAQGTSDGRADLFALGAVMHEALTGRRVFAGANDLATLMNVMEKPVEPPSSVNPQVGEKLDWIVLRALRRDPRQRFASAADMARSLEGYLHAADTDPGAQAVRDLMAEVEPLFRKARPPAIPAAAASAAVAAPPRRTEENTLAVDDTEIVAVSDGATPPPLPTAVVSRFRARRRRRTLLAAGAAVVLTVVVGRGLTVHRPAATAALADPAANGGARAPVAIDRVQIVIDSSPQGALVAHDPQSTPIGETPLLLDLPRGQAPVSFWVRKAGYEPVAYKLIPSASQPVMVRLKARGADDADGGVRPRRGRAR